jgi:hypothetical protein
LLLTARLSSGCGKNGDASHEVFATFGDARAGLLTMCIRLILSPAFTLFVKDANFRRGIF